MSDERIIGEKEGGDIHVAYCSACDREVRLKVPPPPESEEGSGTAAEVYHLRGTCLDVGEDCTGAFCPFGDQPPAAGS